MSKEYLNYILDILSSFDGISHRHMFGGYGLYYRNTIFAIIAAGELYFKVDESNKQDFINAGSEAFCFESKGKKIAMSYRKLPEEVLDNKEILKEWLEKSYQISVKKAPAKKVRES